MRQEALKEIIRWASGQLDKEGRSLLERARVYLLENPLANKYNTEVNWVGDAYEWDCSCPYVKYNNRPCKHVVAKIILMERQELTKSKQWAEWFSQYDKVLAENGRKEYDNLKSERRQDMNRITELQKIWNEVAMYEKMSVEEREEKIVLSIDRCGELEIEKDKLASVIGFLEALVFTASEWKRIADYYEEKYHELKQKLKQEQEHEQTQEQEQEYEEGDELPPF